MDGYIFSNSQNSLYTEEESSSVEVTEDQEDEQMPDYEIERMLMYMNDPNLVHPNFPKLRQTFDPDRHRITSAPSTVVASTGDRIGNHAEFESIETEVSEEIVKLAQRLDSLQVRITDLRKNSSADHTTQYIAKNERLLEGIQRRLNDVSRRVSNTESPNSLVTLFRRVEEMRDSLVRLHEEGCHREDLQHQILRLSIELNQLKIVLEDRRQECRVVENETTVEVNRVKETREKVLSSLSAKTQVFKRKQAELSSLNLKYKERPTKYEEKMKKLEAFSAEVENLKKVNSDLKTQLQEAIKERDLANEDLTTSYDHKEALAQAIHTLESPTIDKVDGGPKLAGLEVGRFVGGAVSPRKVDRQLEIMNSLIEQLEQKKNDYKQVIAEVSEQINLADREYFELTEESHAKDQIIADLNQSIQDRSQVFLSEPQRKGLLTTSGTANMDSDSYEEQPSSNNRSINEELEVTNLKQELNSLMQVLKSEEKWATTLYAHNEQLKKELAEQP